MVKGIQLVVLYMGTVLFPFFFNRSIQYSWYFLIKHFFSCFKCFCSFVLLFVYIIVAVEEDYIKCELIGVGSPRHFFQLFVVVGCTIHIYQYTTVCIVKLDHVDQNNGTY